MDAGLVIGIVILVVGTLAAILYLRAPTQPLVRVATPSAPRAIPLVAVPSEAALQALPRPIRACPDCGYVGLRAASTGVPGSADMLSAQECPHCGYVGLPLEFEEGGDYEDYVSALHRAWRKK